MAVSTFVTDGRLWKTSDFCGRLQTCSGIFGSDHVVFKNPSTPRIKISHLYFRKSWQVCRCLCMLFFLCVCVCLVAKSFVCIVKVGFQESVVHSMIATTLVTQ